MKRFLAVLFVLLVAAPVQAIHYFRDIAGKNEQAAPATADGFWQLYNDGGNAGPVKIKLGDGVVKVVTQAHVDVREYGTLTEGASATAPQQAVNRTTIQDAINGAISGEKDLVFPGVHYQIDGPLYIRPLSTGSRSVSGLTLRGGGVMHAIQYNASLSLRTIIESTNGPALILDVYSGDVAAKGLDLRGIAIENMTFIGNDADDFVLDLRWFHSYSRICDVAVYQKHVNGYGVRVMNTWNSDIDRLYIQGHASKSAGIGFQAYNESYGGGLNRWEQITAKNFVTGARFGGVKYNDYDATTTQPGLGRAWTAIQPLLSTKVRSEANNCTVGFEIGWGVRGLGLTPHTEEISDTAVRLRSGARKVTISGGSLLTTANGPTTAQIDAAYDDGEGSGNRTFYGLSIRESHIWCPPNALGGKGVSFYDETNEATIENNLFDPHTAAEGTAIYLTNAAPTLRVLGNKYNNVGTTVGESVVGYASRITRMEGGKLSRPYNSETLGVGATNISATSNYDVVKITGDGGGNLVTTINGLQAGRTIRLIFLDAFVTLVDGGTLKLGSNYVSALNDTLELTSDGVAWYRKQ